MMTGNQHPLVSDYLDRLRSEAHRRLSADQADELVDDIRGHLRERVAEDATESDMRNALERLGTPSELVDAAGGAQRTPATDPAPVTASNRREMAALALLVLSVVTAVAVPVAGLLLIGGLVLAFTSTRWSGTDKALAAVVYTVVGMPLLFLGGLATFTTTGASVCIQSDTRAGVPAREVCSSGGTGAAPWAAAVVALVILAILAIHVYTAVRLYRHARVPQPRG